MAKLIIIDQLFASHGSIRKKNDMFGVEVIYEGKIENGFTRGLSYSAIKANLHSTLQELSGVWLNEIIGRATKERLAQYLLFKLRSTNPRAIRIKQQNQHVEVSYSETDYSNFEEVLLTWRAEGLLFQGCFKEALELLKDISDEATIRSDVLYLQGRCFKYLEDFIQAKDIFSRIIANDPNNGQAHRNLGNAYYELGDYQSMMKHFDISVDLLPGSARTINNRGFARQALGDFSKAKKDHDAAIAIDPCYAEAYLDRASALEKMGDTAAADEDRKKAQQLIESGMDTYMHKKITL